MTRLLLLELNEINFDHVATYVGMGKLPVLGRLIEKHGVVETTSEKRYEDLEPWIQWVTAHTGKTLSEHGVFRLGDIIRHDIQQIWEELEEQGLSVGAISPMNANNRCRDPAFFLPDPWTPTSVSGSVLLHKLYAAIAQAVNDNAQAKVTLSSAAWLLIATAAYARPANYLRYSNLAASAARGRPWAKALILDQLLADVFLRLVRQKKPDFASLFLNAGAHIQHHYMFNSKAYSGPHENPAWYAKKDSDPVLEVYELYDRIVGQVERAFSKSRLMLATGLHQEPHPEVTFYWRLKDHASFLRRINVPFQRVEPRMSRDFVVYCSDETEAARAASRLREVRAPDRSPLFDVDNRGADLFVMLVWSHDIGDGFEYHIDNRSWRGFREDVAFVAIKNGGHNGTGYFLDTASAAEPQRTCFELRELPSKIAAACGVTGNSSVATAQG